MASTCPGCGAAVIAEGLRLPSQPVILNYRFATPGEAVGVARRDIELRQCPVCALVFNAAFDLAVVPYDDRYENRQSNSPAFLRLMADISDHLATAHDLRRGVVLEVGCGKGAFLRLLCERHRLRGVGYDTSYEEEEVGPGLQDVHFHRRYVKPSDVTFEVSAVVCRHVIEHIPEIGDFMESLWAIASAGQARVVYLETPAWEWIVENQAFWDVFYEHCNYFSLPTLRHLAERVGFRVVRHVRIFGEQYQSLELSLSGDQPAAEPPRIAAERSLSIFSSHFNERRSELELQLARAGAERGWAIWGAGAKGVSLANTLLNPPPGFVIDSNPAKQGSFIPGTNIAVLPPDDSALERIAVLLIPNSNYLDEIRVTLANRGLHPTIITL